MRLNPESPVEDAKVDIRLSVIKPLHAKTMTKAYHFFCTPEGEKLIKSGFRGAGIIDAVRKGRSNQPIADMIDPFQNLAL